ncbi:hypothetical protein CAPTEDRAFT_205574 [Capitella teleta]|uniref:Uncharacterized protein n=1 Tax=Capitella teleta TaxID=283909 RepID=R7U458_CAPTE|nr:hypothetical protein CAPTEDRAFT_205574 [Capitella teleta]|eukprot:ELT98461.1 hypothetical protein CAPTEDRAFT_205574 [Capitella teleta]
MLTVSRRSSKDREIRQNLADETMTSKESIHDDVTGCEGASVCDRNHGNNNSVCAKDYERKRGNDEMEFDEEDEDDIVCLVKMSSPKMSETSSKLLQFMDIVNGDIQKYFGTHGGSEDSHRGMYDNQWEKGQSGKELYYAQLMRVAQGIDTDGDGGTSKGSGVMNKKVGLGPLKELFEYGLKDYWVDPLSARKLKKLKKFRSSSGSVEDCCAPLKKRSLPQSFWSEPKGGIAKAPDFSDLLESWTGDEDKCLTE